MTNAPDNKPDDIDLVLEALPVVLPNGGVKKPVCGKVLREVQAVDLLKLHEAHKHGYLGEGQKTHLRKLRDNHHQIAKMLAENMKHQEIALVSGYGIDRIKTLSSDPSMLELIEFYRNNKTEVAIDLSAKYKALVALGTEELLDRMEEEPEQFTGMQVLDIIERLGDRCGMGPKSQVDARVAIGVAVTDDLLERVKGLVNGEAKGRVVQGHATPSSDNRPATSSDTREGKPPATVRSEQGGKEGA